MDQLSDEQQAELKKTSSDRLRLRLVKAGYSEDDVAELDRAELLRLYAQYLISPPVGAEAVTPAAGVDEIELRRQELELKRLEFERLRLKDEEDKELRREKQELRLRELALREREQKEKEIDRERQRQKDEDDKKRRESLAGQTRFYGDALKHALPKMSSDSSELPAYFRAVENLFAIYDVPKQLQSKLIIPMLTERAKALLARLSKERLDDYFDVRDYLLREFRLSAEQYRDKFLSASKQSDETYTLFGSRVKSMFNYYLDSRKAVSRDDIIDLMVADGIKQTLPDHCLRHVLSLESDS